MSKELDCRGELCPRPVILTKKELDNMTGGTITTIVDNEVAKENVSKLAQSLGLSFTVDKKKEDEYHIQIVKGQADVVVGEVKVENLSKSTIAIGSDKMGSGGEELGKILIKSFIYTVKETEPYPENIVFYNSGVNLTCEGSPVLDDLKALSENGVDIQSCGTCLDYYNIKDKLAVGGISNMYTIYEKMKKANTININ
ncbi:sulfurtransferase-like selenium metabolism protein YedF [Tissierella creatinini]|nr:sulfurtransferase-like selenium metabolism protein YedF [Tissierella creatinini]TJX62243.1 sulfurtransferase-like selenium metabolism protein YedF [Soehngenia saccharolytica]